MTAASPWRRKQPKPKAPGPETLPLFRDLPDGPDFKSMTFAAHQPGCNQCFRFNPSKPATAALCCELGARLLKRGLAMLAPKPVRRGSRLTATDRQAMTQYKK